MLNDVQRIIETLSVPAAEYVPAIGEALTLLQELADRAARPSAVPAGMWLAPMEPDTSMIRAGFYFETDEGVLRFWHALRDHWLTRHSAPPALPAQAEPAPDWRYATLSGRIRDLLHLLSFADIKTPSEGDAAEAVKVMAHLRHFLNTNPAAQEGGQAKGVIRAEPWLKSAEVRERLEGGE